MQTLRDRYGVVPRGVLHLGAHLGEEAPAYADAGVERVLWVEGNPDLMPGLQAAISPYPAQRAVQAVISDEDGQDVVLHVASFTMSSGILPMTGHHRHYPSIVEVGQQRAISITADTLLRREGEDGHPYDMANIDLEGAELLALRGMPNLLPTLKWIYMEVYFEELHAGDGMIDSVDSFLGDRGFSRVATENTQRGWGDALYVRNQAA